MDFLRKLGIQQHHILTAIHYTNIVMTFLQSAFKQTVKTSSYVLDSFKPETYCFFQRQFIAVRMSDYNLENVTSPRIAYYYEKDSGFYRNDPEYSTSRLNLLSVHLYHHNLRVADLSDFFYATTYEAAEGIPQLGYWMAAWQLNTKTFLDITKNFSLHITTILGNRVVIDYNPYSAECDAQWIAVNRDVRHMNQDESDDESSDSDSDSDELPPIVPVVSAPVPTPAPEPVSVPATTSNPEPTLVDASTQTDSPARVDAATQTESTDVQ